MWKRPVVWVASAVGLGSATATIWFSSTEVKTSREWRAELYAAMAKPVMPTAASGDVRKMGDYILGLQEAIATVRICVPGCDWGRA